MRRYSLIHPLFLSFFSKTLYQDAARNWGGMSFVYLLLLVALCLIPSTVRLHVAMLGFLRNEAPRITSQLPTITISKGNVSIDKPSPWFVKDPDTGQPWIVIDTTGSITAPHQVQARALLTATGLIIQKSQAETRVFDLSKVQDFSITPAQVSSWLSYLKWLALLWFPLAVLMVYLYRVVQVCFYALIGMLFAKTSRADLGYGPLVNVAIMAITPAAVLFTVLTSFGIYLRHGWALGLFLSLAFLFYGVKANVLPEYKAGASGDLGSA